MERLFDGIFGRRRGVFGRRWRTLSEGGSDKVDDDDGDDEVGDEVVCYAGWSWLELVVECEAQGGNAPHTRVDIYVAGDATSIYCTATEKWRPAKNDMR